MYDVNEKNTVVKKFSKGNRLLSKGEKIEQLAVLMNGSAIGRFGGLTIRFQPGAVLGLFGIENETGTYCMDYEATEDVVLCFFKFQEIQDFAIVFEQGDNYRQFVMDGCIKGIEQISGYYSTLQMMIEQTCSYIKKQFVRYQKLCAAVGEQAVRCTKLETIEPWECKLGNVEDLRQYFMEFQQIPRDVQKTFFNAGNMLAFRHLRDIIQMSSPLLRGCDMQLGALEENLHLLCGNDDENLFHLYTKLLKSGSLSANTMKDCLNALGEIVALHEKVQKMVINKLQLQMEYTSQTYIQQYKNYVSIYSPIANGEKETVATPEADEERNQVLGYVKDMLEKLLGFSCLSDNFAGEFKLYLERYKNLPDKYSTDDNSRAVRRKLTELFYELYEAVFFRAEKENTTNPAIRLFLNFAVVDETMFNPAVMEYLLKANPEEEIENLPIHVYTIRQWLHEIYVGNKEPSRNEFDMDFQEYMRELTKNKEVVNAQDLERMNSQKEKVRFEMRNFFTMNNRLTSGHLLTFCPVLSEDDLGENLGKQLLTKEKINDAFEKVTYIDFSVFYRDVLYDDRANGINNLTVHKEVLPDVICMPNAGTMGRMWQEISGRKRASAARFSLPILLKEDIIKVVVRMIGSFRWEICKRVQGNYWNDVSEPSLTSEFFDYLQFYKKNRDLTDKAREKIGQLMVKCRNNYGEIFVNNYVVWITSESMGNVRLDKVSRYILGRYCPFSKEFREKLLEQPLFMEALGRYERERKKRLKELNNRRVAIRNCNGKEPEEFINEFTYYER